MKIFKSIAVILFLLGVAHGVLAQKSINAWHEDKIVKNAIVSYEFREVETELTIASHNASKLLNPASTIKLITGLIFLEEYGSDHQFETSIWSNGKIERDGTLKGDLIIYGNGDPSFGSGRYGKKNNLDNRMQEIVNAIRKKGITCVEGNIVVDASVYGSDCTAHTWQYNDLGNYYASGVWSTNINENAYKLELLSKADKSIQLGSISPNVPRLFFDNQLELGPKNSGDQAYIFCAPYQEQAYIRGSIPTGQSPFFIRGAMPNAPLFFGTQLQNSLKQQDIQSMKVEVRYNPVDKGDLIWKHNGVKAKRQVRSAIHKSINLYCESFFKKLGKGNREDASTFITKHLKQQKAITSLDDIQISDGSGLSQRNYISAQSMTKFLVHQYGELGETEWKYYLAQNGFDGTLKNAFVTKNLKGKIYGKSGSMGGVRAYAGFIETKSGKLLAFSIMVNNYTAPSREVYLHIQQLLESIHVVH